MNLEFSDSSGTEEMGSWLAARPFLSPAPSSTARDHVDMYLNITAHTSNSRHGPRLGDPPTHCSVVCPWKGVPREEAHTAPEGSLGPLREIILGSWVPGLGGERYRLRRAQTPGRYIPWPHGALPLWGAVEGSPVQGPVN